MWRRLGKYSVLFAAGAAVYFEVELNWRYWAQTLPVHWTMPLLGGALFLLIGGLNNWLPWEMPLLLQGVAGAAIATAAEFVSGVILNLWLGLGIWDYSGLPLNLWGQICLLFSLAWVVLSIAAVVLDDWLRYWLFGEERPRYKLF